MDKIIERLVNKIPIYLNDIFTITVGPRRFLSTINLKNSKNLGQAALFFTISLVISFLVQWNVLPPKQNPLYLFAAFLILEFVLTFLMAAALRLSWLAVGGKATLMSLFVYSLYMAGPMVMILVIFSLLGDAAFRLFDSKNYLISTKLAASLGQTESDITSTVPLLNIENIFLIIGLIAVYWSFTVAWGAFREINLTTKTKSFIAYFLFNTIIIPFYGIAMLLAVYLWLPQVNPGP